MSPTHPLRRRDADGLMLHQKRILQAIGGGVEPHAACRQEDVTWGTFRDWIEKDEAFRQAFDGLVGSSVGTAKEMIESMAVKATTVLVDALEAEKKISIEVTCPCGCEHGFTAYADVADMSIRMKAMETVLKSTKILKDVRETDVNVTHRLDVEGVIALARWRNKLPVPPHLVEQFRQQGLIGPTEDEMIEGESREVPAEEATP